jgi:thioredoxin reductase
MDILDVIIVGGGPAGLNAAVVLGRCKRKVLVFDTQQYRNRWSHGVHNYLTQDDILPSQFINICHKEIYKYGVKLFYKKVVRARQEKGIFHVKDEDGQSYFSKKLLIATGVKDKLPDIPGFLDFYGHSVFHCPYCDGWEVKEKKLAVYAKEKDGSELALSLRTWSKDVILLTNGGKSLKEKQRKKLEDLKIPINTKKIEKLVGTDNGQLQKIVFKNGEELEMDALFFVNGFEQQCDLAEVFGCEMNRKGVVITNSKQQTTVKGLYVAGDADMDVQFVVVAAAEGAKAGVIINKELQREDKEMT